MSRRVLVTGITGQDGSIAAEQLVARGDEVVGVVRDVAAAHGHPDLSAVAARLSFVAGDLADPPSVGRAVREADPDVVLHLAAPSFVPASWEDPAATFVQVAAATGAVLRAAREDARVVLASSSEAFGDADRSPQDETTTPRPRSPYGVAKLAVWQLARAWREHHGRHVSAAICFNHESARRPARFVTRRVTHGVAAIAAGRSETLVLGDLRAVRDWSHAADVVRGMLLMADADEPTDLVLASGRGRTVGELVEAAFAAAGLDPQGRVEVDPSLVRAPEAVPSVGDPALARERLGWSAQTPFTELVAEMLSADLAALSPR